MDLRFLRYGMGSSYLDYGCAINQITPDALFDAYSKTGFLYAKKLQYLGSHLSKIKDNWQRALHSSLPLLKVITYGERDSPVWASISGWRSTNSCWHMQHLVSRGNPLASCAVLLAESAMRIKSSHIESAQNWFRPENRYAKSVFGTISGIVPDGMFSLFANQIFMIDRSAIGELHAVPLTPADITRDEIRRFALEHKDEVYVKAEELDCDDLELSELDAAYKKCGLRRYRKIVALRDKQSGKINAVALIYRGPLGLSFSFLENRTEILLPRDHSGSLAEIVALLKACLPHYDDFELDAIPVSIAVNQAFLLQSIGVLPMREYSGTICLHSGYPYWYKHIQGIFSPVLERAFRKNKF